MKQAKIRIEVYSKIRDFRGEVLVKKLKRLGIDLDSVYLTDNYLINHDIKDENIDRIAGCFAQSVTQSYTINKPYSPEEFNYAIEIGFLPGVTDNVAHTAREAIEDLLKEKLDPEDSVFSTTTFFIKGHISKDDALRISYELHNPLIQRARVMSLSDYKEKNGMGMDLPVVAISEKLNVDKVNLSIPDEELILLGREGIPDENGTRRGPLALDIVSLKTIKDHFENIEKRNPTDIELESIAQTWSEHCKHTIFASAMDDVKEGIFKEYIKEATHRIRREKGKEDFCVSVFEDNSGGIIFDDNYIISDKVETHNSPSALDPFGGAITGIVGVNRDTIGFGMAAKPVANRYGFCFASPFQDKPLFREKNAGARLLSSRRIMEGVIHGVNVGGNCSGIPTPQGFIYFDERYKGKPLVFVGTVGLLPRHINGRPTVVKKASPGDYIVMVGGRVGRDGIHGATFSSEALSSGSPVGAVQIGDPITQKKLSDAIVKEARDLGLYNSITDNGAGGLSCSVAEMAKESGGFEVELDKVPLKYPGLSPWQIWVSESQERMTLAVPPEKLDEFIDLMGKRGVEATVIGRFDDSGRGVVKFQDMKIFNLDMQFLHDGLPRKSLSTTYTKDAKPCPELPQFNNLTDIFHEMIGRLNTAGFEFISAQYDHEVQANSVIKPLQGKGKVNGNATVIRPVLDSRKGVVMSQGLYPSYSDINTYWMAACSIDTAVRNAISVGGTLERLALLDNFCWCDSNNPERLGQLKKAARACYDIAVAYGTPFVSGKDSMFNDFKGYDENFNEVMISVPPTLLISSIGVVMDVYKCQTIDFKFSEDVIYIVGMTGNETGGSEYLSFIGEKLSGESMLGTNIPKVKPERNLALYRIYEMAMRRGLVSSSISIERGGLGVAIAKSAISGMMGFNIDLSKVPATDKLRDDTILYSESQGRMLVSVDPSRCDEFEEIFEGLPIGRLGNVKEGGDIYIKGTGGEIVVESKVDVIYEFYKRLFKDF